VEVIELGDRCFTD